MAPEIRKERPLTAAERAPVRHMLEHGVPEATRFRSQLAADRVVSRCRCGCASVSFEVAGLPAPSGGLRILGDFEYDGPEGLTGAFVFEQAGVLGGIEVDDLAGGAPPTLPAPAALRPLSASGP